VFRVAAGQYNALSADGNIAAQAAAQTVADAKQKQLLIETQRSNEFNLGFDAGIKMQQVTRLEKDSEIRGV
jgi:hypothetical protein